MTIDTTSPFAGLSGFFFPGDKNDPRVNPQLRQRIALAMMARDRKFPKNLGEGLSAIGDAIGDRALMKQMMDADVAQQGVSPPGEAPVAPIQSPGYAPPSDTAAEAPAVGAINRAIAPSPAPIATAPPQAPATVPPQAPGGGAVPLPMQPGAGQIVDPGEYNAIDAADPRNRYKPAPAYLAPALERNIQDPERRGFIWASSPARRRRAPVKCLSTGAAGPFQFTRGTGAQYGIPGNARLDPDASTVAANALTDDNVQALTAKLGREPTPGEMALAHQQGAGTAGNMLTGAGNAPARNLAVNNVPPGMDPGAAASKIMGYYGMPGPASGGRDAVAAALLTQQQPPSPQRPSVADYGQPLALAATPASGIQAAPPDPATAIRSAPQQTAQAQPDAVPGYVPPEVKDPTGAPIIGMKPREVELRNWLVQNQNNPYAPMRVDTELKALEAERTIRQNEANEKYKADLARGTKRDEQRQQALTDQAKRIADIAHTQAQTRKEGIVENPDEKYILGPDGVAHPIKVEGEDPNAPPGGKLSENEQKTLIYHGWAKLGNQAITGNDKLLAHGLGQEALGKVPVFGNKLQDEQYRRAKNGADNFILSFMRSTSGAAYGVTERLDHAKAMLPKIGDDDRTLADKAAQRQQFVDTEYAGLGKQAQKKADYIAKSYDPGSAEAEQRRVDIEMQGVKGGQVGEVKTNKNPQSPDFGKQRLWNGSRWVEVK